MKHKLAHFFRGFIYAARGIRSAVRCERNFRFQLMAAAFVLWLAGRLGINGAEQAALWLAIGLVLAAELLNTALEAAVDLYSPQQHPLAGRAKDAAAGGVFLAALCSVAVGCIILWKPQELLALAGRILASPAYLAGIGIAAVLAVWFIFGFAEKKRRP